MSISYRNRAYILLFAAAVVYLTSCGGYYYITPVQDDDGLSSTVDTTGVYADSNQCMTVHLWGGDKQGSGTVVQAHGLYLYARVESAIPFTVSFGDPYIITGIDTLAPNMLSVYQKEAGDAKYRHVETIDGYDGYPIAPLEYDFPSGAVRFELRFNALLHSRRSTYYHYPAMAAIPYPISLNLGSVRCGDERIVLNSLWFDATTSLPDSARNATRALRAN
jgi:hypothetical protein